MNCVYCGEEKATQVISNPNMDDDKDWNVCLVCKEIIEQQKGLSLLSILLQSSKKEGLNKDYVNGLESKFSQVKRTIDELGKESCKEVVSVEITKKD